jgi:glucose/arabinose dehydrogenase
VLAWVLQPDWESSPEYRWNRSTKVGGDLVLVTLTGDGNFKSMQPFVPGFIQNNNYVGRPADVMVMKDGSLLVSDDYNGAVY